MPSKDKRIGRPRAKNPRNYALAVNLTQEEYDAVWLHVAMQGDQSASSLIRQLLLNANITKKPLLD